jgi:hypothetical protein
MASTLRPLVLLGVLLGVLLLAACGPANHAPVFDDVGDQVALVGTELQLQLRASDPEGDKLSFSFNSPDKTFNTAMITPYGTDGSQAVFRWTPLAADKGRHAIDFHVSDGTSSATETVNIDVQDKNAPPKFVDPAPSNSGAVFDLGASRCVDIAITVSDPDSAHVTIAEAPPKIDGATLTPNSTGFSAMWHWCPTAAQQDASTDWLLNLTASDGVNAPTPLSYRIFLMKPSQMNCPGAAPVITHTPMDMTTQANLTIKAHVTDDKGLGSPPVVYYTLTPPHMPVDLSMGFTPLPMKLLTGTTTAGDWSADVPNPVASMPANSMATVYYLVGATDNDDPNGSCDHSTHLPATGVFQMKVTNPGGQGNLPPCQPCTTDLQCGGAGDNCVFVGDGNYCGKACSGDGDCPTNYGCKGPVSSVGGTSAKQCEPLSGSCALIVPPSCTDDSYEPNDTLSQADTNAKDTISPGTIYSAKSCPGATGGTNPDFYKVVIAADAEVAFHLSGGQTSDLNLQLVDKDGNEIATSAAVGSSESIDKCLVNGTYFVQVYASTALAPAENSYTLAYSVTAKSCGGAVCMPDANEPNNTQDMGTPIDLTTVQVTYTASALTICTADDDWFAVKLWKDDTVYIAVTFNQATAAQDLDLDFFDGATDLTLCGVAGAPDCSPALGKSVDANEYYTTKVTHDGTYDVHVYGYAGATNTYDICISVFSGVCPTGP